MYYLVIHIFICTSFYLVTDRLIIAIQLSTEFYLISIWKLQNKLAFVEFSLVYVTTNEFISSHKCKAKPVKI